MKHTEIDFPLARMLGQPCRTPLAGGASYVRRLGGRGGALSHRARGEAAERAQAVIHDDGAGGGNVEGKGGRNADEMVAARGKLGRQSAALGAEHIGRPERVGEARQVGSLIEDLDADQAAALGQPELGEASPMVEREVGRGL